MLSALKLDVPFRLQNDKNGQNPTNKKSTKNELLFDEDGDITVLDIVRIVQLIIS